MGSCSLPNIYPVVGKNGMSERMDRKENVLGSCSREIIFHDGDTKVKENKSNPQVHSPTLTATLPTILLPPPSHYFLVFDGGNGGRRFA